MSKPNSELRYGGVAPDEQLEALISSFERPIQRPKTSILYQLGLLLVALFMVLLPVVYVGLIMGVGWLTWTGLVGFVNSGAKGRGLIFGVVAIAVTGLTTIFFMIKPLFAPRPKHAKPYSLSKEEEPVMFGFVAHLCKVVGAPMPKRIDVDLQVNAFAAFRRGWISFFGRDLVLCIGLPLVSGLNLRQLTGVLAHEFGHFAQGAGMRLTYVIRQVNGWFARVVYERDEWDMKLEALSESEVGVVVVISWLTRLATWLSRRILWVLMWLGNAVSCFAMREMEYDADAYETRVSGSETFRSTALQLPILSIVSDRAFDELNQSWQDGHLCDDIPNLIKARLAIIDSEIREKVHEQVLARKTGWGDTHPADIDRIKAAEKQETDGIFHDEQDASVLFANYAQRSRDLTLSYYQEMMPGSVKKENLVSLDAYLEKHASMEEALEAGRAIFGHAALYEYPPLFKAELQPEENTSFPTLIQSWQASHAAMKKNADRIEAPSNHYIEAWNDLTGLKIKQHMDQAGHQVSLEQLQLHKQDCQELSELHKACRLQQKEAAETLDAYAAEGVRRICLVLALLETAEIADRIEDVESKQEEAKTLLALGIKLSNHYAQAVEMTRYTYCLHPLFTQYQEDQENQKLIDEIITISTELQKLLQEIRVALKGEQYPFERVGEPVDLADLIVPEIPNHESAYDMYYAAEHAANRIRKLYVQLMSILAKITIEVETVLESVSADINENAKTQSETQSSDEGNTPDNP